MKELLEKIICLVGAIATTAFFNYICNPVNIYSILFFLKYSFVWVAFFALQNIYLMSFYSELQQLGIDTKGQFTGLIKNNLPQMF
jgi:hypothetical protein